MQIEKTGIDKTKLHWTIGIPTELHGYTLEPFIFLLPSHALLTGIRRGTIIVLSPPIILRE